MSVERNKDTFRRYVDEVWKDEKLDIADEVFAEKYLSHQSDGTVLERGPDDVKQFVTEYRSVFSDVENIVEDMIGEDDKVVNRWTLHVTHTGEFRGHPRHRQTDNDHRNRHLPLLGRRQGRGELGQPRLTGHAATIGSLVARFALREFSNSAFQQFSISGSVVDS
jgi:predicted ester cyclase